MGCNKRLCLYNYKINMRERWLLTVIMWEMIYLMGKKHNSRVADKMIMIIVTIIIIIIINEKDLKSGRSALE